MSTETFVEKKTVYVTLSGLPLSFHLEWPFRPSTSGADFHVLHADIRLENSDGLHAPAAVNLSATLREIVPSLEPRDVESLVINSLRKQVDKRQLEFVKSGKMVPVHFSSRFYDFKKKLWVFGKASAEDINRLILHKVYWQSRVGAGAAWLADETDALYVSVTLKEWLAAAENLEEEGWFKLENGRATASDKLLREAGKFEADMQTALDELEKKHAFERGAR